jgi:glutamine amidotransferase
MITIVDYGMGNLGSVRNMLKRIGVSSVISDQPRDIAAATKLILPGVGAFGQAMAELSRRGFLDVLQQKALDEKVPVLGICLGMQLLTRHSEEGDVAGLGWIQAETKRFRHLPGLKVPHMGWNLATPSSPHPVTADLPAEQRYYFVHSYCVQVDDPAQSLLKAHHGITFDAGIQNGNILGVQFHPEKSHRFGKELMARFAKL